MAYEVDFKTPDGFVIYLVNVLAVAATVAWLFLLFIRSIDEKLIKYRKPFSIAMTLQLLFVTLRNFSTMLLSSGFPIHCRWVAVVGGVIYQLFAISAECAMLIRCRSFTRYPKLVTYLTLPTWVVRMGMVFYLVTTIEGEDNVAGYICQTTMDFNLSAIMQYIKIATEAIILIFFLERVIALHRSSKVMHEDATHWRRLALINSGITFLVILFEVLVGQITVYLTDYLFLTYSLVNFIQAVLVVFIVEDTKNVFRRRQQSSNNASRGATNNSQNRSGEQRDDTLTYSSGLASKQQQQQQHSPTASTTRYSNEPWSVTVRVPQAAAADGDVQHIYRPNKSSDRPGSFYDFGAADSGAQHNRHWDVDTSSSQESNQWKSGKPEDTIPMTYTRTANKEYGH
ncbi:hypothetical protein DFQ27_001012 [Actinomortierella ambigua]|uniref:Uncharacterized protein n=1 Tax=Actinomortierella ambigua TaxID=1343610 RepID=A0A9P6QDP4_9FUNG|nr:hypothetical protein DFQ27_001012 [Actinomortierella ambigua]